MDDINFQLKIFKRYSSDELLEELRRVAKVSDRKSLNTIDFLKHSNVAISTITKRFGSWSAALDKAGLADSKTTLASALQMTDEQLLNEIVKLSHRLQTTSLSHSQIKNSSVSWRILQRRFGSWQKAVELAGLIPIIQSNLAKNYTNEECFENLLNVWTDKGRQPTYREMSLSPSLIGAKTYKQRFGSWNETLRQFVQKINSDINVTNSFDTKSKDIKISKTKPKEAIIPAKHDKKVNKQEYRRDISIGLRFKILNRDCFKCVLCGNSPATLLNCKLHVDHILPWSKGGKTTFENLRTLCADCNIGRSNHYLE